MEKSAVHKGVCNRKTSNRISIISLRTPDNGRRRTPNKDCKPDPLGRHNLTNPGQDLNMVQIANLLPLKRLSQESLQNLM